VSAVIRHSSSFTSLLTYNFKLWNGRCSKLGEVLNFAAIEFLLLFLGAFRSLFLLISIKVLIVTFSAWSNLRLSTSVSILTSISSWTSLIRLQLGQAHTNLFFIKILINVDTCVIIVPINLVTFDWVQPFGHFIREFTNLLLKLVMYFTLAPWIILKEFSFVLQYFERTFNL